MLKSITLQSIAACETSLKKSIAALEAAQKRHDDALVVLTRAKVEVEKRGDAYAHSADDRTAKELVDAKTAAVLAEEKTAALARQLSIARSAKKTAEDALTAAQAEHEREQRAKAIAEALDETSIDTFREVAMSECLKMLEHEAALHESIKKIGAAFAKSLEASKRLRALGEPCTDLSFAHVAQAVLDALCDAGEVKRAELDYSQRPHAAPHLSELDDRIARGLLPLDDAISAYFGRTPLEGIRLRSGGWTNRTEADITAEHDAVRSARSAIEIRAALARVQPKPRTPPPMPPAPSEPPRDTGRPGAPPPRVITA